MEIKKLKNTSGVTLIELLVAVAITVIVGASVIGAIYSGRSAWQSGDNIIRRYEKARVVVDFMSRDIAAAYIYPVGPFVQDWDPRFEYPDDDDGAIDFTALISAKGEIHELRRIRYWVDDGELWREEEKLRSGQAPESEVLVSGVSDLIFEFLSDEVDDGVELHDPRWYRYHEDNVGWWLEYAGEAEREAHQRGRIPRVVLFEFTVEDGEGNHETFSSMVYLEGSGRVINIP